MPAPMPGCITRKGAATLAMPTISAGPGVSGHCGLRVCCRCAVAMDRAPVARCGQRAVSGGPLAHGLGRRVCDGHAHRDFCGLQARVAGHLVRPALSEAPAAVAQCCQRTPQALQTRSDTKRICFEYNSLHGYCQNFRPNAREPARCQQRPVSLHQRTGRTLDAHRHAGARQGVSSNALSF
eukprot:gene2724-3871_t